MVEQDGVLSVAPGVVAEYRAEGWWDEESVSTLVRSHAARDPGGVAVVAGGRSWTWATYDERADAVAAALAGLGLDRGDRVAVLLPDGLAIHAVLVGCARAGLVAVGIGHRAGDAEVRHLIARTGARVLVTHEVHRGEPTRDLVARVGDAVDGLRHWVLAEDGPPTQAAPPRAGELTGTDVSMLNSTSGTTGLPKCVTQFDQRWLHFSALAVDAGRLTPDDVVLAVVPTPFGFGLWTSHFVGTLLGARTVVMPRFSADEMVALIERERATVLCCVSTQFRMLLNSPAVEQHDLSSLRVMFTGGEAVPYDRALEFERRTGATVLQFFGSNETGALSCTTLEDDAEVRLRTAGRVLPHMQVRLYDEHGRPVPGEVAEGQPAGRGPLTCAGYYRDDAANAQLYAADGWMLMGDVVRRDASGCLSVVGRQSDFVIRGGKNISSVEVEAAVDRHPAVALVAVVPVPDDVFGERVCAVVTLHPGASLTLEQLGEHLTALGVSREWHPERLVVVEEMPRSSGGKIAKAQVRELAVAQVAAG
ncbi:acyl--CoA ligase [Nocardioides anomalus]|uniref:Acyl--CoA ligase n=1 Tax=Nocardioides anomalus TaxID=2712223 RepID=A0A6G6WLQ7_9ACTN|nr:acyl--CoA ligase [Nocardioides anomalus]